jgi:hypothetical protein
MMMWQFMKLSTLEKSDTNTLNNGPKQRSKYGNAFRMIRRKWHLAKERNYFTDSDSKTSGKYEKVGRHGEK